MRLRGKRRLQTAQPEHFAIMASAYAKAMLGVEKPRVGLLNNGAEAHKGNELAQETYKLLSETQGINFVGNCEARDLLSGDFDVVVSDGFNGNIALKSAEGTAKHGAETHQRRHLRRWSRRKNRCAFAQTRFQKRQKEDGLQRSRRRVLPWSQQSRHQISRLVKSKIRDCKHIAGKIPCAKRRRESDKRRDKRFESGRNASVNVFWKTYMQKESDVKSIEK